MTASVEAGLMLPQMLINFVSVYNNIGPFYFILRKDKPQSASIEAYKPMSLEHANVKYTSWCVHFGQFGLYSFTSPSRHRDLLYGDGPPSCSCCRPSGQGSILSFIIGSVGLSLSFSVSGCHLRRWVGGRGGSPHSSPPPPPPLSTPKPGWSLEDRRETPPTPVGFFSFLQLLVFFGFFFSLHGLH